MSLAKVIEVLAEGKTVEDAVQGAVDEASETVNNIKGVYVKDIQALVENNKVTGYRINAKITFIVQK
ncbi:MAG TPA: dodecin family protein [Desulfuromonadales bacterium]|nr:dodecin family protein [Desulfuromonadales bacterium]